MRIFIENFISLHQYEIFFVVTFGLILFITEKLFKELSEE